MSKNIVIIGASGSIGCALSKHYLNTEPQSSVILCSREEFQLTDGKTKHVKIDISQEDSIRLAAQSVANIGELSRIIITTGMLHSDRIKPEKTFKDLDPHKMEQVFKINTIGPALVAKHFIPLMAKKSDSVFAALSARVGSISDNRLGGWYSYRASKVALNMIIKNLSIEHKLKLPLGVFIGLHPGTVVGALSKPFSKNIPKEKVFSPEFSAEKLYQIIENVTTEKSGQIIDWKGNSLEY